MELELKFNVPVFMQLVAPFLTCLCDKVTVEPGSNKKKLSGIIKAVSAVNALFGLVSISLISVMLHFLNQHWKWIFVITFLPAVLPPLLAFLDKGKSEEAVQRGYIRKNLGFNVIGAGCACAAFFLARMAIGDFNFLQEFPLDGIISLFVPLCLWIGFAYQNIEQQAQGLDHDASLKWINQIFNVFHLFNVCFWALVSSMLLISYTFYCYIYHIPMSLKITHLVFLSVIFVFFYGCGFHELKHVYLVCVIDVPMILICSIYWMSWFAVDFKMILLQVIFVAGHSLMYTYVIYRREKIAEITRSREKKEGYKIQARILLWSIRIKNGFYLIAFLVGLVSYTTLLLIPYSVQKISFNRAQRYIIEICKDTSQDSEEVFARIRQSSWADEETESLVRMQYLKFVYENLYTELYEKGIISDKDRRLTYEKLEKWYNDDLPAN